MPVNKNLEHFEFILSGINMFTRIHRSYILNVDQVKKILKSDDGTLIPENKTDGDNHAERNKNPAIDNNQLTLQLTGIV